MKKTLILGATTNTERYAYKAAHKLNTHGHQIVLVGIKKGELLGETIINNKEIVSGVDTVTMYIGKRHQAEWYEYIIKTNPKRILFNPGTENEELVSLAKENGIETEEACTLILLNTGQY